MRLFRPFLPLLLVFTLLFVQQGAAMHGIAHVLAEQQQDHSLPHQPNCDLCAAYAQIGSGIGSTAIHFDFDVASGTILTALPDSQTANPCAAFAARAPPHSV